MGVSFPLTYRCRQVFNPRALWKLLAVIGIEQDTCTVGQASDAHQLNASVSRFADPGRNLIFFSLCCYG
jgi:hypothetical protein